MTLLHGVCQLAICNEGHLLTSKTPDLKETVGITKANAVLIHTFKKKRI
jgi:hypothetical protein